MASEEILVVEDNPANMRLTRDILESLGYRVMGAVDAPTGISLAREHNPALILMDLSLPGMDGLQATEALKRDPQTSHIPVVALTAHAMERNRESARAAGCADFITKPIDLKNFRRLVAQWVPQAPEPAPAAPQPSPKNRRPRVLLVDDEPLNCQLLRAMSESLGWDSETCASGFEALEALHPAIDLVLLDVMMPGLDGFSVARRIRASLEFHDLPILMVTALSGREERL